MNNLQLRDRLCGALLSVFSSTCFMLGCNLPAFASPDPECDAGMAAYQRNDYNGAIAHFQKSIQNGNKNSTVYLFSGFAFAKLNQLRRAYLTYEIITKLFKGTPDAETAADLMEKLGPQIGIKPTPVAKPAAAKAPAAGMPSKPIAVSVIPPLFMHPAVSKASLAAIQQAIAALPAPLRARLEAMGAKIVISPNLIDRWPDSMKDLPENEDTPTLAELPGRIYGVEMCVYERAKERGSTALKDARSPAVIRLQVDNMCFQLLDGDLMTISKDPGLRREWEAEKASIPDSMEPKLGTFMKTDDWGPRETCSELFGSMLGGSDENTANLYRYFPRTKKWLAAKMGIPGQ